MVRWTALALVSGCVLSSTPYERRFDELLTPPDVPTPDTDPPIVTCHLDIDGDGFGSGPSVGEAPCGAFAVEGDADCDDGRADIHPGAPELCDGDDQGCDGGTDAGVVSWNGVPYATLSAALADYTFDVDSPDPAIAVCGGPGSFGAHDVDAPFPADLVLRGIPVAGQDPVLTAQMPGPFYAASGQLELSGVELVGAGSQGCLQVDGAASLVGVTLRGCSSVGDGGGLRVGEAATVTLTDTRFLGNTATRGGGLAVLEGGSASGSGNEFVGNSADLGGGMLVLGNVYLPSIEATDNVAAQAGGAVFSQGSLDVGGVFEGNQAERGAAVSVEGGYAYASGQLRGNGVGEVSAVYVSQGSLYGYDLALRDQGVAVEVGPGGGFDMFDGNGVFDGNEIGMLQSDISAYVFMYGATMSDNVVDVQDALGQSFVGVAGGYVECSSNGCLVGL